MSDRIVYLAPDVHAVTQQLLPWYVNGRLDATEKAEVEAHLADCPPCRAELEFERELQTAVRTQGGPLPAADSGWADRLDRIEAGAPAHLEPAAPAGRRAGRWKAWAAPGALSIALSVALVLALGFTLKPLLAPGDDYHALSAPAEEDSTAVVRFKPEATEHEIRHALNESGARLVDGPTATDAYVVRLPRERYVAALRTLRGQPGVRLVEALEGADEP